MEKTEVEYPIAMLTRGGAVRMKAGEVSGDRTPRYEANPNAPGNTYALSTCLKDGCQPIYSMIEVIRLKKIYEEKWEKKDVEPIVNKANKLKPSSIKILQNLSCKYREEEAKIVEHMIGSENPLRTFFEEVQFYRPNEEFVGLVLLLVGKDLNLYLKNTIE